MSRDHFWRSISRDTDEEVPALAPPDYAEHEGVNQPALLSSQKRRAFNGIVEQLSVLFQLLCQLF